MPIMEKLLSHILPSLKFYIQMSQNNKAFMIFYVL